MFLCAGTARAHDVVPAPQRIVDLPVRYAFARATTISARGGALALVPVVRSALARHGVAAAVSLSTAANDAALGSEGYRLRVTAEGIAIDANAAAGLFYGVQTLDQLLPPSGATSMQGIDIADWPAYRWRGIHLDVSRHFFPVSVVERFIDVAARYKLNVFHWHLTDDQGWRIAIARYPRLTDIGACRAGTEMEGDATEIDAKRYCGYYTQSDVRRIVAYARERYVTIVPEIEMPGHSQAAIAAYPRLGCGGGRVGVRETWGVSAVIYCPTEYTFTFLENVLREVMALFPGRYVHIGGDEVPTTAWERSAAVRRLMRERGIATYAGVQGYFDRRIERFLAANGRRAIGWDDVLRGGITANAAAMVWHTDASAAAAPRRGIDAVMSPDGPLYFDAYQGDPNDEPQAIGGLSTPEMVYEYDPASGLTPAQRTHLLGVQGNVWSEYIDTPQYLWYMVLPRLLSVSEIAWTDPHPRDWGSFESRMGARIAPLFAAGYAPRIPNPAFAVTGQGLRFASVSRSVRTVDARVTQSAVSVAISTIVPEAAVHYTTDGSSPTAASPVYGGPLAFALAPNERIDILAVTVLPGGRISTPSELVLRREGSAGAGQNGADNAEPLR